jgi:membrane protease YdiL (CAAX protease family)
VTEGSEQQPGGDGRSIVQAGGCIYVVLLLAALLWLHFRGRLGALPEQAIGSHGLAVAAGAGLACGLLATALLALAARVLAPLQRLERRIGSLLGGLNDVQVLGLSLLGALAEELFFRLAALDATDLKWSVALFVVVNTGPGFWAWAPVALAMAVTFGVMVESGLGLLSVTIAHALLNYLTLRRILAP